ncbi:hypothetical protein N658DRAFT_500929 [Parathielavia hyrcaniae]|uniref:Uncharacterized protein n=1 Tax=Parathielavia hyrcaniae TaxID=113614 RepID=A0AAN6PVX8_9PEZI|nr:hypothetical protein N658DRAFT_500929 [Parathielavia hyrcaniae]
MPDNDETTHHEGEVNLAPTPQTSSSPLAPLELLPFEIQRLILAQSPTFNTLRAFVHASPQLHSVYVQDRQRIVRDFVEQSFDGFLVDAHAAYISGSESFQQSRSNAPTWEFIDAYRDQLATAVASASALAAQLPWDQVMHLIRFHCSIIEPLTERYATWALAAMSSSPENRYPLSGTERRRIQRALYRLQIYCNVCGSRGERLSASSPLTGSVDRLRVLGVFLAWQIEEVLCIHEFAKDIYGGLLHRVAWDLDEARNPKYSHLSLWEVREELLVLSGEPEQYKIRQRSLDSMLCQGLTVLSAVLETTAHEELVELVRQSILLRPDYGFDWIDDDTTENYQEYRRQDWYSAEDAAQDRRDKISFGIDTPDLPSLAWVILWEGEASNLFGAYVPRTLARWGYVMWDAPRLQASGAIKHIPLERRTYYNPREIHYLDGGWY